MSSKAQTCADLAISGVGTKSPQGISRPPPIAHLFVSGLLTPAQDFSPGTQPNASASRSNRKRDCAVGTFNHLATVILSSSSSPSPYLLPELVMANLTLPAPLENSNSNIEIHGAIFVHYMYSSRGKHSPITANFSPGCTEWPTVHLEVLVRHDDANEFFTCGRENMRQPKCLAILPNDWTPTCACKSTHKYTNIY
jgi:hypothetical protein